jgi:hypothetical protein
MKHLLIAGAAISLLSTALQTQAGDGWSVTLEPEHERVKVSGGGDFYSDSLAMSVALRDGENKYDFKVETDKDHDATGATGGKWEARYRRYFGKVLGIEPSVRVSAGENICSPDNFTFYTIQPKLAYEIGDWEPYFSVRYRSAFNSQKYGYQTRTYYLGAAYSFNKWEIEPSVFHKNGDDHTNGVKLEITRNF